MVFEEVKRRIKPWVLPAAMVGGVLCHGFIERIAFLSPYLIFAMLLITFCRIDLRSLQITRMSFVLLSVQIVGAIMLYYAALPLGHVVAQGVFMCVFCPVATAAPVVAGMLGGSVSRLAMFSIVSNLAVAVLSPVLFPLVGSSVEVGFGESAVAISARVLPLIVVPLVVAVLLSHVVPKVHKVIASHQSVSFYIWSVALFIVVGRAVSFVIAEPVEKIPEIAVVALCSGIICVAQFAVGRMVGRRCGDVVVGGQGLGQKNTILAIWMSLTYLNPLSSVGPAAYVFWQNMVNSWQIYRRVRPGKT